MSITDRSLPMWPTPAAVTISTTCCRALSAQRVMSLRRSCSGAEAISVHSSRQ